MTPRKFCAVADEDDLVLDADAEAGEFFEVGERAVVGVDDRAGDVAGGRESVEGGQDARVVLEGVAAVFGGIDVLGRGAGHELVAAGVEGFDEDAGGLVEQDFVGDDAGFEAGGLELFGDVEGGLVVLGGAGPVGFGGEDFEVLAGELRVGDGQEGGIPFGLLGEVAVAEDLLRSG